MYDTHLQNLVTKHMQYSLAGYVDCNVNAEMGFENSCSVTLVYFAQECRTAGVEFGLRTR